MSRWQSNIDPPYPNPFLIEDPLDYKRLEFLHREIDLRLHDRDKKEQKQAIANAYRVASLARDGKSLEDVARHYQDMLHIPYDVDDPKVYNEALEVPRVAYNRTKYNDGEIHKPHKDAIKDFYRYFQAMHPYLTPDQVREQADAHINHLKYEIEHKLYEEDPSKLYDEKKVLKALERRLKQFVKQKKTSAKSNDLPSDLYPPYSQRSIYGLANASRHIDDLHNLIMNSYKDEPGGYTFRDKALSNGYSNLGPKEHSLAWYLLHPNTSDIAIVDPAMEDALGHKNVSDRDYGLLERQLQAARDASGYGFIPLSQFQKGLNDLYYGPSDLTSIRVRNPIPYHQVQYPNVTPTDDWPRWFKDTEPYRRQIEDDWNRHIAPNYPERSTPHFSSAHTTLEIPKPIRDRVYRWACYHFEYPASPENYVIQIDPQEFNLDGLKLSATEIRKNIHGFDCQKLVFGSQLYINSGTKRSGQYNDIPDSIGDNYAFSIPIGDRQKYDSLSVPPISFRVRAHNPARWQLATISPEVTNENPDPMANENSDAELWGPMPSQKFLDHEWYCQYCHGTQLIEMDGKKSVCPYCANRPEERHAQPGTGQDPARDNPAPGQLNPELLERGA